MKMKKSSYSSIKNIVAKQAQATGDQERGEGGKRARGHVQLSILIPSETRDDLRMGINFDPKKRDLSELVTDLINGWLDTLPASYQDVRPSRRQDEGTAGRQGVQK